LSKTRERALFPAIGIAAPISTIDINIPDGSHIKITERNPDEVRKIQGVYHSEKHPSLIPLLMSLRPAMSAPSSQIVALRSLPAPNRFKH
jgi:methylthioribose-1-phosphate isomerase